MSSLIQILRVHKQLAVLLLWVGFLGVTIWQHAQQTQQPPIGDAIDYFTKAYNFWAEMHNFQLFNPFNVQPTFRPPGTVLLSYPFGFNVDFRPFYFRSIFIPILLVCLAVVISGYRQVSDSQGKWNLVVTTVFISTLPCFYQFEYLETSPAFIWGFVDWFLAGMAALAAAATVRSILTESLAWTRLAALFSSFCLTIKPSGIFVMFLMGMTWLGLGIFKLKLAWNVSGEKARIIQWLWRGMLAFTLLYSAVIAVSFTSQYLSHQNLAYGNGAIEIMRNEFAFSLRVILQVIHYGGFGYPIIAWWAVMTLLAGHYFWKMPDIPPKSKMVFAGFAVASVITLLFGIWFWLIWSGGSIIVRYFIPFLLMTLVFAMPVIMVALRPLQIQSRAILIVAMLAPAVNLGILLVQRTPSLEWQRWSGLNLASGLNSPLYEQANNFVRQIKREGHNTVIYGFNPVGSAVIFGSVLTHSLKTMQPMPSISAIIPVDWQRPSTFRLAEMLSANYWFFSPIHDQAEAKAILDNVNVMMDNPNSGLASDDPRGRNGTPNNPVSFGEEIRLFEAWATFLTEKDGVAIVSESPTARLIRITDLTLLESSLDAFVAKHRWGDAFVNANPKRRNK